ncbi:hypothetical protein BC008_07350 [Mastigocoleus testarum BC008]|uniref:DUF4189 domain-containing protein n=2 Tax=Mastigocoleus TaxID=996924 RepID=A0A0V7ZBL0_9CYAN|nr:hypothetical protein BC008_07350 [Mastigocoleus testarum BC008]
MFCKVSLFQLALAATISSPVSLLVIAPAQAQNYYGAIAYSEASGSHGFSYDYSNRSAAGVRAMRECENGSGYGDCKVLIWFRNACGALAKAPSGAYGSGWGADRSTAERYAIETCNQHGQKCRVVRWVCTTR